MATGLRDAGGGGNFASGPTTTFRGHKLDARQRAAVLKYLYENQAQDLPVGFLDRLNKGQIEQDAVTSATQPGSHPERTYTSSVNVSPALSPFDPQWSQQFLKPSTGQQAGFAPIFGNLLKDVGRTTLGLPAFAYTSVTDPRQAAHDYVSSYKQSYAPFVSAIGSAAQGHPLAAYHDVRTGLAQVEEHPLGYLLDATAVGSIAGKFVPRVRAGVPFERSLTADQAPATRGLSRDGDQAFASSRPPTEQTIQTPTGPVQARVGSLTFNPDAARTEGGISIQPYSSPNPVARALQHAFDRYSEARPDQRFTGARARITRALPYEAERDLDRAMQAGVPFDQLRQQLSKPENTAYDAMRRYGDKASERLDQEIQTRQARIAAGGDPVRMGQNAAGETVYRSAENPRATTLNPAEAVTQMSLIERKGQERTIAQLSKAREHVESPSQLLQDTVDRGRQLTELYQRKRVEMGQLTDDQAADHVNMSSRLATGGRFVDIPGASPALTRARLAEVMAQKKLDRATARSEKAVAGLAEHMDRSAAAVKPPPAEATRPITRAETEAQLAKLEKEHEREITSMVKAQGWGKIEQALHAKINQDRGAARAAHKRAADAMAKRGLGRPELNLPPSLRDRQRAGVMSDLSEILNSGHVPPELEQFAARDTEIDRLKGLLEGGGERHWLDDPLTDEEKAASGSVDFGSVADPAALAKMQADYAAKIARHEQRPVGGHVVTQQGDVLDPKGHTRQQRTVGARLQATHTRRTQLDEAAAKRQQLEERARRRFGAVPADQAERRLVGGEDAGEGAFYAPDIEKITPGRAFARARGVLGKPKPLTQRSRGVLFEQGRTRRDAKLTLEGFASTARHSRQLEDIHRLLQSSRPLDNSLPGGVEEGHVAINPEGIKLAVGHRMPAEQLEGLSPKEIARVLDLESSKFNAAAFPEEEHLSNLSPAQLKKVRQVRKEYADAFIADVRAERFSRLAQVFDLTNNITKSAMIYLKPSYIVANRAGNYAFLGIHQGLHAPRNLARASGLTKRLAAAGWGPEWVKAATVRLAGVSETTLGRIDLEVGGGGAAALAPEGRGVVKNFTQKVSDFSGRYADRNPRRAAWLREAEKRGYKTDAQINDLLDNPAKRPQLNQISEAAEQAMVKFRGLSTTEKRIVSRAIFIYPWVKGASRYGVRLAIDHPVKASTLGHMGDAGASEQEEVLGRVVSYLDSLVPTSKVYNAFGTKIVNVRNPNPVTPVGTLGEVFEALGGVVGLTATKRDLAPIQFATPVVKALVESTARYDTFRRRAYPDKQSSASIFLHSLLGTADRPNVPILQAGITAFTKPQTAPFTGDASRQGNYVKEGGLRDALRQAFLGSTRTRQLNLTAAQAKGHEEELEGMDPVPRAIERARDKQTDLVQQAVKYGIITKPADVPGLADAFTAEQARDAAYAHEAEKLDVPLNRLKLIDRTKVDLDLAVEAGLLDRATADSALETLKGLTPNQLKTQRQQFLSQLFPWGATLTAVRRAVRQAGGTA